MSFNRILLLIHWLFNPALLNLHPVDKSIESATHFHFRQLWKKAATPNPEIGKPKRDINLIRKGNFTKNRCRLIRDCGGDCLVSYASRQLQTFKQWYENNSSFYSHQLNFSELNPTFTKTYKSLRSTLFPTVFEESATKPIQTFHHFGRQPSEEYYTHQAWVFFLVMFKNCILSKRSEEISPTAKSNCSKLLLQRLER